MDYKELKQYLYLLLPVAGYWFFSLYGSWLFEILEINSKRGVMYKYFWFIAGASAVMTAVIIFFVVIKEGKTRQLVVTLIDTLSSAAYRFMTRPSNSNKLPDLGGYYKAEFQKGCFGILYRKKDLK